MNYYNEYDRKTAAWLRELIKAGAIPDGHVDERSIADVQPSDLRGYTQCHFFAGIGGWSYALQLAGWPADRPVWTGSCPCQPFSTAGKGLAQADKRHLWPVFFDLIRKCRPEHVFGEQVASAIGHGWLDGVSADLEAEGYACGATVLGAHSVNSPHQRQRLYWVAHARHLRRGDGAIAEGSPCDAVAGCSVGMDDAECARLQGLGIPRSVDSGNGLGGGVSQSAEASGNDHRLEQPDSRRCELSEEQHSDTLPNTTNGDSRGQHPDGPCGHLWSDFQLVHCRDGKARRVPTEPAFFPLAHGIPARVVRLRGYGNAIVPQTAAEFVAAFMDIEAD